MLLALVIGILLVLAVAGLCAYFPQVAKFVGIVNNAGLFVLIVLLGLVAAGTALLSHIQ